MKINIKAAAILLGVVLGTLAGWSYAVQERLDAQNQQVQK